MLFYLSFLHDILTNVREKQHFNSPLCPVGIAYENPYICVNVLFQMAFHETVRDRRGDSWLQMSLLDVDPELSYNLSDEHMMEVGDLRQAHKLIWLLPPW